MAISNKFGLMVVTTGNKSEMSVGYATLYGDMNGGFNPIKDLYKTEVYRLARLRNRWKPADALGPDGPVIVDAKSGSSAGGQEGGPAHAHPERAGVMRLYAPAGHRHTPEIEQESGVTIALSCHAVDAVRGVLATCHAPFTRETTEKDLWRVYRAAYGDEPFVRIVHDAAGLYREPEPKILTGSNFCDVGFAVDPHARRVVAVSALDNLGKGAAGNAVQCWNIRAGFPETLGLTFPGLHPI